MQCNDDECDEDDTLHELAKLLLKAGKVEFSFPKHYDKKEIARPMHMQSAQSISNLGRSDMITYDHLRSCSSLLFPIKVHRPDASLELIG